MNMVELLCWCLLTICIALCVKCLALHPLPILISMSSLWIKNITLSSFILQIFPPVCHLLLFVYGYFFFLSMQDFYRVEGINLVLWLSGVCVVLTKYLANSLLCWDCVFFKPLWFFLVLLEFHLFLFKTLIHLAFILVNSAWFFSLKWHPGCSKTICWIIDLFPTDLKFYFKPLLNIPYILGCISRLWFIASSVHLKKNTLL